jgi:hypothetical protein
MSGFVDAKGKQQDYELYDSSKYFFIHDMPGDGSTSGGAGAMCYNPGMHVALLRVALALYSVGFAHAVLITSGQRYWLSLAGLSVTSHR